MNIFSSWQKDLEVSSKHYHVCQDSKYLKMKKKQNSENWQRLLMKNLEDHALLLFDLSGPCKNHMADGG